MIKKILFLFLISTLLCYSQTSENFFGGEYKFNPDNIPCLTSENKKQIKSQLNESINRLTDLGVISEVSTKQIQNFIWPVRKASNSNFFDFWGISNYVDHNSNYPNQLQDYNCGTRTYDTESGYNHQGIDIYTWPFSWYQFEKNLAEVIAGAAGTIIFKSDGNYDKSCNFNNNQWNAVYIRHNDGSVAWYGHLKSGSLTSKNVGNTVVAGEYLGVIGSSGNSSGPHLHFEVYDSMNNLIDPYNGACNNSSSWWQEQKDYYEPNINALIAHNDSPNFLDCPNTEEVNINIKGKFLPDQRVYLASYFRDQQSGTTANYSLYRPDGSVHSSWSQDFTNTYSASYWYWWFDTLPNLGTWRFEVAYQRQTENITFDVVSTLSLEDTILNTISISPNPTNDIVRVTSGNTDKYKCSIYNSIGQVVLSKNELSSEINIDYLINGIYYLKITAKDSGASKTFPIIKN